VGYEKCQAKKECSGHAINAIYVDVQRFISITSARALNAHAFEKDSHETTLRIFTLSGLIIELHKV
jgi:hypothetical protein